MPKGIYKHSKTQGMFGKKHTDKTKEKLKLANLKRYRSGEVFGYQKGHKDFVPKESRKRQAQKLKGRVYLHRRGIPSWNAGKTGIFSKEVLQRIGLKSKEMWKNEEMVKKILNSLWKSKGQGPNIPENKLLEILKELNMSEYRYVGDYTFWIGRANPDFVNTKQKRVIEMFGKYWHKESEVKERTNYFQKYGYSTLIVWDYELSNKELVKQKILDFENCHKQSLDFL